ncbi:MAG: hypothetical protein ACYTER_05575 [Planctomycetota bacterium]|jgi:hypothetical protein
MDSQRLLKRIHVCGTLWFLLCAATLLVFSLHQAGFHWWLIFSISGYSAVVLFFLFTVYLFAIYRGVVRNQTSAEHPLSTSVYYVAFYDLAPFLGSAAGLLGILWPAPFSSVINTVTQGTLLTTFLLWTVFDPVIGLIEMSLPSSKAHRKQRLEQARQEKLRQQIESEQLLDQLENQENEQQQRWDAMFTPLAKEVSVLLSGGDCQDSAKERIIEFGALAWKTGRIICMRYFHEMILQEMQIPSDELSVDYTAIWWDGIGTWRKPNELPKLYRTPVA